MKNRILAAAAALLCFSFMANTATAEFGVSVSGSAIQLIAPDSAGPNDLISNNYEVWHEGRSTIVEDLHVDHLGQSGTFNADKDALASFGGTIDAGTTVDSYIAHLDLPSSVCCCTLGKHAYPSSASPQATLAFDSAIVGIAMFVGTLDQSDFLGETLYATGNSLRGLGSLNGGDSFTISEDGKTLSLNWSALGKDYDQIRVLTSAGTFGGGQVPEPASAAIWSIASVWGLIAIRKRRKR